MKREVFTAVDGKEISVAVWESENPRALVQIAHGMAEHIERYDAFARYLNGLGYTVFGDDHRGHGQTDPDALGLTGGGDIFALTVSDMMALSSLFIERYRLPLVLYGHSYGSFLSEAYLNAGCTHLAGCVLSGSALMDGGTLAFGKLLAKTKKPDTPGEIFASITFRAYDRKINEGINGWLTRDKAEVGKYNTDPLCGFTCSYGFYRAFFNGLIGINKDKTKTARPNFPLLLISGNRDGVGGKNAKLVKKLDAYYRKKGFAPTLKIFDGARHETLNETNRDEVFAYISAFIDQAVSVENA